MSARYSWTPRTPNSTGVLTVEEMNLFGPQPLNNGPTGSEVTARSNLDRLIGEDRKNRRMEKSWPPRAEAFAAECRLGAANPILDQCEQPIPDCFPSWRRPGG